MVREIENEFPKTNTSRCTAVINCRELCRHEFAIAQRLDDKLAPVGASSEHNVIVGGENNGTRDATKHSFIGGGKGNESGSSYGYIGGGKANLLTGTSGSASSSAFNIIVGGYCNKIDTAAALGSCYNFIGGGLNHLICADKCFSIIGGGCNHTITGNYSGIFSGGDAVTGNKVISDYSSVSGGRCNYVCGNYGYLGVGNAILLLVGKSIAL